MMAQDALGLDAPGVLPDSAEICHLDNLGSNDFDKSLGQVPGLAGT